VASQDISSLASLANVIDVHGRLLQSAYKDEPDISELGDMIRETVNKRLKVKEASGVLYKAQIYTLE
jgi:hypothetical protein